MSARRRIPPVSRGSTFLGRRRSYLAILVFLSAGLYFLLGISRRRPYSPLQAWSEPSVPSEYRVPGGIGDGYKKTNIRGDNEVVSTLISAHAYGRSMEDNASRRTRTRHDKPARDERTTADGSAVDTPPSRDQSTDAGWKRQNGISSPDWSYGEEVQNTTRNKENMVSSSLKLPSSTDPSVNLENGDDQLLVTAAANTAVSSSSPKCEKNKTLLLLHYHATMPSLQVRGDREFLFYCPKICTVWEHTGRTEHAKVADVVEFHDYAGSPPERGFPNQLYMFFTMESPHHSSLSSDYQMARFNLLRSYHIDSDIFAAYIPIGTKHIKEIIGPPLVPFAEKNQDALAAMIISNCNAASKRLTLVRQLQKYISVHSFGTCLHNKDLPREQVQKGGSIPFIRKYKFYFALENSLCRDYITEKLFRALYHGVIPIVSSYNGVPNYTLFTPNAHSYINAEDFKTVKDLAVHLKRVAANETLYNSYLAHRFNVSAISETYMHLWGPQFDRRRWCTLAEKMSTPGGLEKLRKRKLKADHSCAPYGFYRKPVNSSRVHHRAPHLHHKAHKRKKKLSSSAMNKRVLRTKLKLSHSASHGSSTREWRAEHVEKVTSHSTHPIAPILQSMSTALIPQQRITGNKSSDERIGSSKHSSYSTKSWLRKRPPPTRQYDELQNHQNSLKQVHDTSLAGTIASPTKRVHSFHETHFDTTLASNKVEQKVSRSRAQDSVNLSRSSQRQTRKTARLRKVNLVKKKQPDMHLTQQKSSRTNYKDQQRQRQAATHHGDQTEKLQIPNAKSTQSKNEIFKNQKLLGKNLQLRSGKVSSTFYSTRSGRLPSVKQSSLSMATVNARLSATEKWPSKQRRKMQESVSARPTANSKLSAKSRWPIRSRSHQHGSQHDSQQVPTPYTFPKNKNPQRTVPIRRRSGSRIASSQLIRPMYRMAKWKAIVRRASSSLGPSQKMPRVKMRPKVEHMKKKVLHQPSAKFSRKNVRPITYHRSHRPAQRLQ